MKIQNFSFEINFYETLPAQVIRKIFHTFFVERSNQETYDTVLILDPVSFAF